jgi:hypothetical protein
MTYDNDDLTESQREAITEAESAIVQIVSDTRARLAETGMDFPVPAEGSTRCLRCDCEFFMSSSTPGRPSLICRRSSCRHSFTVHDVQ